jgi:signal peptidase I
MKIHLPSLARRFAGHWLGSTLLMVLVAFSFRSAVADWNDVPTGSMRPTILVGDRIFVNKLAYDLKLPFTKVRLISWDDPARGDVVICTSPADGARLVKRVVAVPGDEVAMREGKLILNGRPVDYRRTDPEPWVEALGPEAEGLTFFMEDLPGRSHVVAMMPARANARDWGPVRVPEGQFFMMGDNRDNSADSRYFGFIPRRDVAGKVTGVALSLDRDHGWTPRWNRFGRGLI